jgi:hypothetical protein
MSEAVALVTTNQESPSFPFFSSSSSSSASSASYNISILHGGVLETSSGLRRR